MGIGLANYVYWSTGRVTYVSKVAKAFIDRVVADGGTVESKACLISALTYLNPTPPVPLTGYLLTDYSGAAAAYSLRLLRDIYVGSAIRVRRASDNTEQNIGFVNNELDTASLETFCSGTDGFVTTWYDQSGNANNAAQATAANQPKIVSSGAAYLLNSKPAISGSGVRGLLMNTQLNISTDFFIATTLQYAQSKMILGDRNGGSNFIYRASGAEYRARIAGFNAQFGNALTLGTQYNSNVFRVGGDVDHSRNGTLNGVISGASGSFVINTLMNGYDSTSFSMNGYAQEVIIWESDQSSNRSVIETNINDHYTIY